MDSNEQKLMEQLTEYSRKVITVLLRERKSVLDNPEYGGTELDYFADEMAAQLLDERKKADALVAAAVEECAKVAHNEADYYMSHPNSVDWDKQVALIRSQQSQRIAELIKQKTPDHAHRALELREVRAEFNEHVVRRALELREVKARMEEAKDYTTIVRAMVESPRAHKRCLRECESHLADLERRLRNLEEAK